MYYVLIPMFLIMFGLKLASVGIMAGVGWGVVTAPLWVPMLIALFVYLVLLVLHLYGKN